ncbi:MAG: transglutaminase domain-containing protein [Planctomycetes bacterium]|nr:transglutaminase domain-containing protein [Planctomycetota bacterium]
MKDKCLLGICFLLVVINVVGCRKKSTPSSPQSGEQTEVATQAEPDKTVAEKPLPKETVPAIDVAEAHEEETEYFAVFMEGKKVGYAIQSRVVDGDKVTTSDELSLTLNRAGISLSVTVNTKIVETPDGKPLGFECIQDMGLMKVEVSGTIQPDGKLALINRSAGAEQKSIVEWPSGALMAEGLRLLGEEKGLQEGTEYSCRVFDPTMTRALDAKISVGTKEQVDLLGRVVTLTEVTIRQGIPGMGEITTRSYLDEDYSLQKSVSPVMGFTLEIVACSKEFALGKNDIVELVDKMFIDSPVPLDDLGSTESVVYHLDPLPEAKLTIPPNDNQQVQQFDGGKLILTVKPVVAPLGVTFPYRGDNEAALKALEPTPFVQSEQKVIIDLARRAVGSTKDAAEAVSKIEAFVADYIDDKNLSVGYASAVEVAESRQGDCTEHAVLAAALCRAVGIPAQVVSGLAYVDQWGTVVNGFGGHAWTQAYVGEKWIGLDAAFKGTGRGGYDAGHIALASGNGDPGDFFSLVTSMGQFEIDRIEVKKK